MPIELTPQQRQALASAHTAGVIELVDPVSRRVYVLIDREVYERLRPQIEQSAYPAGDVRSRMDPMMLRSMEAYWRELPQLLAGKARRDGWVAYHGDERVAFGKSMTELYQLCLGRGLRRGEFYVGRLKMDGDGLPPWATRQGDWSLYEVNDPDEGPLSSAGK
jgi:hypothetical protein